MIFKHIGIIKRVGIKKYLFDFKILFIKNVKNIIFLTIFYTSFLKSIKFKYFLDYKLYLIVNNQLNLKNTKKIALNIDKYKKFIYENVDKFSETKTNYYYLSVFFENIFDYKNTKKYFEKYCELYNAQLENINDDYLILDEKNLKNLGFISHIDAFLKGMILGKIEKKKLKFCLDDKSTIANKYLLKYLTKYIQIESKSKLTKNKTKLYLPHLFKLKNNNIIHNPAIHLSDLNQEWERKKMKPLFKLSDEDEEYYKNNFMKLFNLKPKDWFVCLHVREGGYKGSNRIYDADINSYFKAINKINNMGGYVFRVGDNSMSKITSLGDKFIDYANSKYKSDKMDIILFAKCKFFIGTSSGPYTLAKVFGTPILVTNYPSISSMYLTNKDIYLPKLIFDKNKNQLQSFSNIFNYPYNILNIDQTIDYLNIDYINNTEDDIYYAVLEMLSNLKLINKNIHTDNEKLLNKYNKLLNKLYSDKNFNGTKINSRISLKFLTKHNQLLN